MARSNQLSWPTTNTAGRYDEEAMAIAQSMSISAPPIKRLMATMFSAGPLRPRFTPAPPVAGDDAAATDCTAVQDESASRSLLLASGTL